MADIEATPASPDVAADLAPAAGPRPGSTARTAADRSENDHEECISVVARVRPCPQISESVDIKQSSIEIAIPRGGDVVNHQVDQYRFHFNRVFGPSCTQTELFNGAVRDLVLGALDGVNCTIFAYGQTGSGKTFTICGGKGSYNDRGIIPRALGCIFDAIDLRRQDGINYSVAVSFIEIYKEQGYNLLTARDAKDIRKNERRGDVTISFIGEAPTLRGAPPIQINSEDEGLHQYFLGDTNRQVAETPHNPNSSRSHCLFSISITASDPATQTVRTSKVQIVDLAGSERLKPYESGSQSDPKLMAEATKINLSLHFLESVINALNTKSKLIPYRNSFLTSVLKDALGGNARAVMFATLNATDVALPETISTLRFAQRVANVKTNARVNEELDPQVVIAALKQEKAELKAALAQAEGGEEVEDLPEDELRRMVRRFLEEENDGTAGGATLNVGSLRNAYASFRIFRELFWELLRSRANRSVSASPKAEATETKTSVASSEDAESRPPDHSEGMRKPEPVANKSTAEVVPTNGLTESVEDLRAKLKEAEGELRMCRAALAAQPPQPARPAARAARSLPPRRISANAATQTEAPAVKRSRPKRPSSADARSRGAKGIGTIGFSMEDVVDRRADASNFSNVTAAPGVPDFRTMRSQSPALKKSPSSSSAVCALPPIRRSWDADMTMPAQVDQVRRSEPMAAAATAPQLANQLSSSASPNTTAATSSGPTAEAKPTLPGASASASWLKATTALTQDEVASMGDGAEAYGIFLRHDPRAADIWPQDLKALRAERLERMEEARALGEAIESTKEATRKVQASLEALKVKLRDAESQAAIDPEGPAEKTVSMLRQLLSVEEPKLVQLLVEKRQRYELDHTRLKELKRELSHLEHGEKKIESVIQAEFQLWRQAVRERYPHAPQKAPSIKSDLTATASATAIRPPSDSPSNTLASSHGSQNLASTQGSQVLEQVNAGTNEARVSQPVVAAAQAAPSELEALAKAETMLQNLRQRLAEARTSGDDRRVQMLEQLLTTEEPRLARMRAETGVG